MTTLYHCGILDGGHKNRGAEGHLRLRSRQIAALCHLEPDPGNSGVGSLRLVRRFLKALSVFCARRVLFCFYVTIFERFVSNMNKTLSKTRILVECGLMIALATVLGYIPIFELVHGGSVTLVSMLPILIVSFRHGIKWGSLTAFVHSLIQLVLGIKNLTYCQTVTAIIGCIFLDYILAFTVLGLAYVFAKPFKNKVLGVGIGSLAACLCRYICSFFSGYVVWKDYDWAFEWMTEFGWGEKIANMGENALCWLYSAVYNATYMLPETIITVIVAVVLCAAMPKLFAAQGE